MTTFLKWLKPFYEAGFIQLLAASGTLLAVCVALWPHFNRWRTRARMSVEIPKGYVAEKLLPQSVGNFSHDTESVYASVAKLRVRNVGKTAAVGVRVIATDFYFSEPDKCSLESNTETSLPPIDARVDQLPAGLTMCFSVCGCSVHGNAISGYRVGGAPGSSAVTFGAGQTSVKFTGDKPTLRIGLHFVRLVVSADAVIPTTHFLAIDVGDEVRLRFASARERRTIRNADRERDAVEVSRG
jgi:hypothetical protein